MIKNEWLQREGVYSVDVLRTRAARRLPRAVFDFIDGGADDEIAWARNTQQFRDIQMMPRIMQSTPDCDLTTEVLGKTLKTPVMVAPTGLTGMFWPEGERHVARACAAAGTIMTVSHATTIPTRDLAAEAPDHPLWAQTVVYNDADFNLEMVERARQANCHALVVTVDLQALGQRERDLRNGFTIPPKITPSSALEALRHPAWLKDYFTGPEITMANYASDGKTDLASLAEHMSKIFDCRIGWNDLRPIRDAWKGPLVIKGILHPDDARLAVDHGADAIIVSNHGGRQLDSAPAPIEALLDVVDAVGDRAEVYLCSGIRRGTDVLKCLALGAKAVLVGRAHLYGVAAGGEAGVRGALDLLGIEMQRAMALGGWNTLSMLDRDSVRRG